jgi:hypothetical protein
MIITAVSEVPAQPPLQLDFRTIHNALVGHFASLDNYQPGDLLCQSQIEAGLDSVRNAGWEVKQAPRIVALGLADNSFLVRELSTARGRTFMRKIARYPGAYARLDRLSSVSRGESLVRDLIRQRDGDKLIEYLATTKGGHHLGGMLAGAQQGADLNKPTGRIYTAEDLLAELKREFVKLPNQK